ncbi:MAG: hypothetical protein K2M12_07965, partial [Muribaculaceae bacterium]|nr:hypothetical protein [Muribaculaceae bacterium]
PNWNNKPPFVHIAAKRAPHPQPTITLTAFTNDGRATLYVDGRKFGEAVPDEVNVLLWTDVPASPGTVREVCTRHSSDKFIIKSDNFVNL